MTETVYDVNATPGPTQLYRCYSIDGALLYVGVSYSAVARFAIHRKTGWSSSVGQIKVETFPTRQEALAAETFAIVNEKPRFNIIGVLKPRPTKLPNPSKPPKPPKQREPIQLQLRLPLVASELKEEGRLIFPEMEDLRNWFLTGDKEYVIIPDGLGSHQKEIFIILTKYTHGLDIYKLALVINGSLTRKRVESVRAAMKSMAKKKLVKPLTRFISPRGAQVWVLQCKTDSENARAS